MGPALRSIQGAVAQTATRSRWIISMSQGRSVVVLWLRHAGWHSSPPLRCGFSPPTEVSATMQQRPHEGLLHPDTGQALCPNDMYATLVSAAGYVPLMLGADDYIELLPTQWRTINDYGLEGDVAEK